MSTHSRRNEQERRRPSLTFFSRAIPKAFRNFFNRPTSRSVPRELDASDVVIDHRAPAKVQFGNGEFMQVGLEPGPDGDTLEVQRRSAETKSAALKIQSAFRRYKARALFESLQALDKMNLEIKWPEAIPFIGLLIVRVNTIHNLHGGKTDSIRRLRQLEGHSVVRTALLRTKFDDDTSVNVPGFKDKEHVINYNHAATFVHVALRSNSILTIEVIQSLEWAARILGKVTLPIQTIAQGSTERSEDIRSPSGEVIGVMNMTVGYQWLRDTVDYGGYLGPDILVMSSRKIRGVMPNQAVERLWKVNHWVCSHDNVYCAAQDFADVVREAVRRERNKSTSITAYGPDGVSQELEAIPTTLRFKEVHGESKQVALSPAELLQETAGTADWTKLEPFDSVSSSVSTNASFGDLGKENWLNAWLQANQSERSDGASSSIVEAEVDYDYDKTPEELIRVEESDESSESSETETESIPPSPTQPDQASSTGGASGKKTLKKECPTKKLLKLMKAQKHTLNERPMIPCITGKFEYGVYRPASQRGVHLFARRSDNSSEWGYSGLSTFYMGEHQTSRIGRLIHPLPRSIACVPGLYNIMAMLPDDNTFGHGSFFLLEKGTKCVIFDLDGTITTSDVHVVAQTLLDSVSASTVIGASIGRSYDIRARPHALSCVRAWAAKGYQVVYLSGRQGSAYNMTLEWLIKHGYPPGPIHLTRTHLPTLPVYVSVGHFKIKYMEELRAKGLELYAAYGNTGTDIKAYEKAGIPKERTFIVGTHGGKKNTKAVKDFTTHLPEVLLFPDSNKPLPYSELLQTSPTQADNWVGLS